MSELNLVLLGPPGSGKGTQGERLQEDFRLPYYATGDILREAVREETEIGKQAKEYMDRGDLVPDEVIIGVIRDRVNSQEAQDGFILDGFPRTEPQAEALDEAMDDLGRDISAAVLIDVPDEEVDPPPLRPADLREEGPCLPRRLRPAEERGRLRRLRRPPPDPRRRQARGGEAQAGHVP